MLQQLELIRTKRPIIQSITNHVTVNDCANILLAAGASPIMAHHREEVDEVQRNASGLVINLGATDDFESIEIAVNTANKLNHPVVLDPVGVTVSTYRRKFALELFEKHHIDAVRGNHSELMSLAYGFGTQSGLDSSVELDNLSDRKKYIEVLQSFSEKTKAILVASGETDLVVYKENFAEIKSGDSLMKNVTGMGCMCSNVLCAFMAVDNSMESAVNAITFYGDCGKVAAEKTKALGTMAFKEQFINEVSKKGCLSL